MGYISKQIYFHGRIIINENINTAVYIMLLQQIDIYVLEEVRKI